jgi:hypothetical protein
VTKQVIALSILWAVAMLTPAVLLVTVGVKQLDQATALQCRHHDWPQSAHKEHMRWCTDNGYLTK